MSKSVPDNSGGAKPPNLHSGFRELEDSVTNLTIFVDRWAEACKMVDENDRVEAMLSLADMWDSLGAP